MTVAMTRLGYGLQSASTASARPVSSKRSASVERIVGRQRSTARGVKNGLTSPRRRRWSSPLMCRMLRRISSHSGPSSIPKISAIFIPGNVNARLRRKNSPASRSSATNPSGIDASQLCAASSRIVSWNRGPLRVGSR